MASRLIRTATITVPASRPRREPGPSTPAATVASTLPAVTVSRTANTEVTAAAGPTRRPCTSTALSATSTSRLTGSSSPVSTSDQARRRRGSGSRLNSSGRRNGSPASALWATRPPIHSRDTRARTSVAAASRGKLSHPVSRVPTAVTRTRAPVTATAAVDVPVSWCRAMARRNPIRTRTTTAPGQAAWSR